MLPTRIKFFLKIITALVSVSILVSAGLWFYEEFQASRYQDEVPFELQLKVPPEKILYSEAYKNGKGRNEIKYAYLAGEVSPILDEDVARRTPTSQTVVLDTFKDEAGKTLEKLRTTFTTDPQFFNDNGVWKQIEYATTTQEIFSMSGAIPNIKKREFVERGMHKLLGIKPVFAAVSTFYPNADVETTSVDGYINSLSSDNLLGSDAWTNARAGATLSATDNTTNDEVRASLIIVPRTGNYNGNIGRTFLLFDTSSLTTAATISSVTLSIYVITVTNVNPGSGDALSVITTTPASNTAIVTGDWGNVGTTLQATGVSLSTLTASAYNGITLNSTGLGNVSKTSITKFGLRIAEDISNTQPVDGSINSVVYASADTTGTTQDPKLDVTYTTGSFSVGQWFPF